MRWSEDTAASLANQLLTGPAFAFPHFLARSIVLQYKKDHIEEIDANEKVCQKKPWTKDEEGAFHRGFQLYGTNWTMYEGLLPRRTPTALELYYHRVYKYEKLNGGPSYSKHARLQQKFAAAKRDEEDDDDDDDDDDEEEDADDGQETAEDGNNYNGRKIAAAERPGAVPSNAISQQALEASAMEQAGFLQQNHAAAAFAYANAAAAAQQQAAVAAATAGAGFPSNYLNPALFLQQQQLQQQQLPPHLMAQLQMERQLQLNAELQAQLGASPFSQMPPQARLYPGALNPFAAAAAGATGFTFAPVPAGVGSGAGFPPAPAPAAAAGSSGAAYPPGLLAAAGAEQPDPAASADLLRYYQLYR